MGIYCIKYLLLGSVASPACLKGDRAAEYGRRDGCEPVTKNAMRTNETLALFHFTQQQFCHSVGSMNLLCAFIALQCPKHRLSFAPPWVMSPKAWLKCPKGSWIEQLRRRINRKETRLGTMSTADCSTGAAEHGTLQQTPAARAIFLRSNGEWMEYEGGSGTGSRACAEENQSFGETSTYTTIHNS